jgi:RNA polymerase sigma-70 factor, ECF subfamily
MFNEKTKLELTKGNPEAFKEVFRLLYPRMKGYCRLFVPDEDQAEDIIQETFIAFWEKHRTIDIHQRIESLLFVILRNRCLNFLKNTRINGGKMSFDQVDIETLQYLYQLDLNEKEDKSLEEMLIVSFQEAVESLPHKMKNIFVRCKLQGEKQSDVARELGISIKTIEKQISKAKKQVREQLLKKYPLLSVLIAMLMG